MNWNLELWSGHSRLRQFTPDADDLTLMHFELGSLIAHLERASLEDCQNLTVTIRLTPKNLSK